MIHVFYYDENLIWIKDDVVTFELLLLNLPQLNSSCREHRVHLFFPCNTFCIYVFDKSDYVRSTMNSNIMLNYYLYHVLLWKHLKLLPQICISCDDLMSTLFLLLALHYFVSFLFRWCSMKCTIITELSCTMERHERLWDIA